MSSRPAGTVSFRAVARSLGLAPSTVSRALAGNPAISAATRARVLAAAAAMGGGGLLPARPGRRLIVLLLRQGAGPPPSSGAPGPSAGPGTFTGDILTGLGAGAEELGAEFHLVACDDAIAGRLDRDPLQLATILGRRPDALVLLGWGEEPALRTLTAIWPCASLLPLPQALPVVTFALDHIQAVGVLLDHLLELGHRRIGFVGCDHRDGRGAERLGAFVGACALRGLAWDQDRLLTCAGDAGDAGDARRVVAVTRAGVQAWVADSHMIGSQVWRWLTAAGIAVPEACSLASFAGVQRLPDGRLLTRVGGPFATIGRLAAGILLSPWERSRPPCRLMFSVGLEPGETTAPPPAG